MSALTERPRWRRACQEDIRLVPIDAETYLVESESGNDYLLDVRNRQCSCPDHEYRGVSCKHLLRWVQEGEYAR